MVVSDPYYYHRPEHPVPAIGALFPGCPKCRGTVPAQAVGFLSRAPGPAPPTYRRGPGWAGLLVTVVRLEKSPDDRPTGNAYWLASEGVQTLLATEIANGEATASREDPPVDRADGARESDLGTAAAGGGTFLESGHCRVAPDSVRLLAYGA